ncbi:putative RNA helicase SDE3 [Abeliophyllum distichum]|uniref:RNA helicase SDE3 n=1 Tax=Abeliophyllum distichum TaxID=126358 RepID=A0ABD1SBS2_9LAMI
MGFLEILQCILCCEEEEKLVTERNRYGYYEIADRDNDFVSSICSKLRSIRFRPTNTTTTNAAGFHHENNQIFSNASSILSGDTNFQSSILVKSPGIVEYNYGSINSGKNYDRSNVIKGDRNPERRVDKPFEFRDKNLKVSSSSSSSSSFVKTVRTLPLDPQKPIEGSQKGKGLAQNVYSASSQESQPSFKLPVTLHSSKSSSSSLLENLKGSAPVTSSSSVKPVPTRPLDPHKSIDGRQKGKQLPQIVSSASLKESHSSFKSPVASHLSKSSSSSSLLERSPSPKPRPLSTKPTLFQTLDQQGTTKYVLIEEGSSTYVFPEDIKRSIEKEIVPGVLKKPLSMSTYKSYFHALLYAEDCYLEKWDGFEMKNVNLELHNAEILVKVGFLTRYKHKVKDEKIFVTFEVGKNRPFLLSRDFISVRPSNGEGNEFQGIFYRLVGNNLLLAEFGDNFHSQYQPDCKYDVKFSFNRVCLKRAHHAITVASEALLRNLLFPEFIQENNVTLHGTVY